MPRCVICMQERPQLQFKTGRISICRHCVCAINLINVSAREAGPSYVAKFRRNVIRYNPAAALWPTSWFEKRLPEHIEDPERVHHSLELRLLRAYQRGLVCLDRRHLKLPPDWPVRRLIVKDTDGFACHRCHVVEGDGSALHVHHIIHRSRSGTNNQKNLVALCAQCHQEQHPDIVIGADRGEPDGVDEEPEASDAFPPLDPILHALSTSLDPQHRAQLQPSPDPLDLTPPQPVPTPARAPMPDPPGASIDPELPATPVAPRPTTLITQESARPSASHASTGDAFSFVAIGLLASVVAAVFLGVALAPTSTRVDAVPPHAVPAATSTPSAIAAPAVAASTPKSPGEQWQVDASSFIAKRCELSDMRPQVRAQVTRNYQIFQRMLDELHGKSWSNQQLLETAGERVYDDPSYTHRGTCP